MENQAHGLATDSTVNKRFSPVKQIGFMSMFHSSSVKRTACAIAFAVACVPTIALGEGISKLLVRELFLKQQLLVLLQNQLILRRQKQ